MPNVFVDTINELELEEERGVIRSVTRNALVEFGSNEIAAFRANTSILRLALDALDAQGLIDGSHIGNPLDMANPYHALYLTKRSPKLIADTQKVNVKLRYDHVLDGHNQALTDTFAGVNTLAPELNTVYGKGRCSVVDKTTNFFHPNGDETKPRTPIQVAYTFPPWEKGLPATAHNPDSPMTVRQGGEISIPFPQANFNFQGLVVTGQPYMLARKIIRHINSTKWNGEPPLTWLCTEVSWEFSGHLKRAVIGPLPTYKMSFEFQFNSDTWEPFVIFNDARWGNPPANPEPYEIQIAFEADANGVVRLGRNRYTGELQPGDAWKVPALPRRDFTKFFGAAMDGLGGPFP